jgi:TPP-dependent indolepyruvate ferredoxin oxidoreductase alpha subunit
VEELIGLGLKYIKPGNKIEFKYGKVFAEVDLRKCTGCGICTDHICLASYMENGTAKVKVDDCIGCGMCVALCPQGAVSLRERS